MPQEVHREEHPMQVVHPAPQEQVPMQVPPIQQVEPMPQANTEIHEIHSDLDEENDSSIFPINFYTSMTSSILIAHSFGCIIDSSFPQFISNYLSYH